MEYIINNSSESFNNLYIKKRRIKINKNFVINR